MTRVKLFLLLLLIMGVGILSYKLAYSFFSDSAASTNNTFTAASVFPTGTHLVINEIGSHGDKKKEWVELFNPTSSPVNVSGWKITDNNETDIFPTVTPIPAGGFAVIVPNNTDVIVPGSAIAIVLSDNNIGNGLADPGDELHLKNASDTIIDEVSYGNDLTVFNPAPTFPPANKSLARSPNGVDTDTAADWVVDSTPSLGVAN